MAEIITHSYPDYPSSASKPIYYTTSVVWYVLGVAEGLLGIRFLLRLFGANPAAGFTDLIYRATAPLVDPFVNVVRSSRIETGIVEWSTIIAMVVYWLLAWAIVRLFFVARPVSRYEAEREIRKDI